MKILLDRFVEDELFFDYVNFDYYLDSKTCENFVSDVIFNS